MSKRRKKRERGRGGGKERERERNRNIIVNITIQYPTMESFQPLEGRRKGEREGRRVRRMGGVEGERRRWEP